MIMNQSDTILKKYEVSSDKLDTFSKLIMHMEFQHISELHYIM